MSLLYSSCLCESGNKFKFCCYEAIKAHDLKKIAAHIPKFPIEECSIYTYGEAEGMQVALIIRSLPHGTYIASFCLIDLWCLGVKDAGCLIDATVEKVGQLRSRFLKMVEIEASYEHVRSLVLGARDYAASIGFTPHSDFNGAQYLIEPQRSYEKRYTYGHKGKPFYVAGPYDENSREISQKVQEQGGNCVFPVDGPYEM